MRNYRHPLKNLMATAAIAGFSLPTVCLAQEAELLSQLAALKKETLGAAPLIQHPQHLAPHPQQAQHAQNIHTLEAQIAELRKQLESRESPEAHAQHEAQLRALQAEVARLTPHKPAEELHRPAPTPSESPEFQAIREKLESRIKVLEAEVARLRALSTTGEETPADVELQKKVNEETAEFIKNAATNIDKINMSNVQKLVNEIQTAQSPQALLDVYQWAQSQYTQWDTLSPAAQGRIESTMEMLGKTRLYDSVILKPQRDKEAAELQELALSAKADYEQLKQELERDLAYIKVSPLTIIMFIPDDKLSDKDFNKNLATLNNYLKSMPLRDKKAVFYYLYTKGIKPDASAQEYIKAFMSDLQKGIVAGQNGSGVKNYKKEFAPDTAAMTALSSLGGLTKNEKITDFLSGKTATAPSRPHGPPPPPPGPAPKLTPSKAPPPPGPAPKLTPSKAPPPPGPAPKLTTAGTPTEKITGIIKSTTSLQDGRVQIGLEVGGNISKYIVPSTPSLKVGDSISFDKTNVKTKGIQKNITGNIQITHTS